MTGNPSQGPVNPRAEGDINVRLLGMLSAVQGSVQVFDGALRAMTLGDAIWPEWMTPAGCETASAIADALDHLSNLTIALRERYRDLLHRSRAEAALVRSPFSLEVS